MPRCSCPTPNGSNGPSACASRRPGCLPRPGSRRSSTPLPDREGGEQVDDAFGAVDADVGGVAYLRNLCRAGDDAACDPPLFAPLPNDVERRQVPEVVAGEQHRGGAVAEGPQRAALVEAGQANLED